MKVRDLLWQRKTVGVLAAVLLVQGWLAHAELAGPVSTPAPEVGASQEALQGVEQPSAGTAQGDTFPIKFPLAIPRLGMFELVGSVNMDKQSFTLSCEPQKKTFDFHIA